jgi:predicted DNA-binding transcriptional regulator AlpA
MQAVTITQISLSELETFIDNSIKKVFFNQSQINQAPPDQWLNLSQLCEYLPSNPSKATVYGWVNKKCIPYHKKTKSLSFLKSEIDSWLMEGRQLTKAESKKAVTKETDSYLITRRNQKCR